MGGQGVLRSIGVVMLLAISSVGAVPDAHAGSVVFDFDKKGDDAGWKPLAGKWRVESRGYAPEKSKNDSNSYAFSILEKSFGDVDVLVKSPPMKVMSIHQYRAILRSSYRKRGKEYNISGYAMSIIFDRLSGEITAGIRRYDSLILSHPPQSQSEELCFKKFPGPRAQKFDMRVIAEGAQLKVLYGNKILCTARDGKFKKGMVGLMAADNSVNPETVAFKSIKIKY